MKKIIIALNNKKVYDYLIENKNIKIIGRDIQYEDGILEILENNFDIDYILISDSLIKNNLEELIIKIKKINKNIKIIYFLDKENNNKIFILNKYNINNIFINNKINLEYLENIIENKKINNNYSKNKINNKKISDNYFKNIKLINYKKFLNIILLKKIIKIILNIIYKIKNNKEKILKKYINKDLKKINIQEFYNNILKRYNYFLKNKIINFFKDKKISKKNKIENNILFNKKKIISIDGINNSGKTIFSIFLSKYLEKENNKILIVDCDRNLKKILGIKLKNNNEIIKYSRNIDILNYENNKKYNYIYFKKIYDFIIIDFFNNFNYEEKGKIIKISDINFILLEPNLKNILETQELIKIYKKILNNCTYKIQIIKNKINKYSLKDDTIKICLPQINILGKIKYKKIYNKIINENFKCELINDKIKYYFIEKEYKKIIK